MKKFAISFLSRLGGYNPGTLGQFQRDDHEPILKFGLAVLLSALISAFNWSMGTWTLTDGVSFYYRILMTLCLGFFGFVLVAALDSSFLYFADSSDAPWFKKICYGIARALIILLVSAITSQAIIPLLLRPELQAHALHMAEESEKLRRGELENQLKLASKQETANKMMREVEKLEKMMEIIPEDIKKRIDYAKQNWNRYFQSKNRLIASGHTVSQAKAILAEKAARCTRLEKEANENKEAYLQNLRNQLNMAMDAKNRAINKLAETDEIVSMKTSQARIIEETAFNPLSATVLTSLIERDKGVFFKYLLISGFFLVLELLPLILKVIVGRTSIGEKIVIERKINRMWLQSRYLEADNEFKIAQSFGEAASEACLKALGSTEGRAIFSQIFSGYMLAVAPTEAVNKMMQKIERQQYDLDDYMRRFPRLATVIMEAWTRAIKETTMILQHNCHSS